MRASELFIPTLREDPGDAEAASHRLLVRGGFVRQVAAGLWTFLPLGWRVHRKAEQIVREEMNAIGGQEMFMPVVTPAELWQTTGRYDIPELGNVRGLVASNGEARRQIKGGGLRVNDAAVTDEKMVLTPSDLTPEGVIKLSIGKKKHVLLKPA